MKLKTYRADEWSGSSQIYHPMEVEAALAAKDAEISRLLSAIRWALGEEGEFPVEPEPIAGKYRKRYYWRTELRQRAFGEFIDAHQEPKP